MHWEKNQRSECYAVNFYSIMLSLRCNCITNAWVEFKQRKKTSKLQTRANKQTPEKTTTHTTHTQKLYQMLLSHIFWLHRESGFLTHLAHVATHFTTQLPLHFGFSFQHQFFFVYFIFSLKMIKLRIHRACCL